MQKGTAIGVIVAVMILGAGGYKAGVFKHQATPDEMLRASVVSSLDTTSKDISIDISGTTHDNPADTVGKKLFSSHIDVANNTKPATAGDSRGLLTFSASVVPPNSSDSLDIAGELRMIGMIFYLKVSKLPVIPFFDPKSVINQWFKLDPIALAKQFGDEKVAKDIEAKINDSIGSDNQSYQAELSSEYEKNPFIVNEKFVDEQKVGDRNLRVISFSIDKTKLGNFLIALGAYEQAKSLAGKDITDKQKASMQDDMQKTQVEVGNLLQAIDFNNLTLGVDASDNLPYSFSANVSLADTQQATPATVELDFKGVVNSYNQPVVVDAPADSLSIEKLFGPLFMGMMQSSISSGGEGDIMNKGGMLPLGQSN